MKHYRFRPDRPSRKAVQAAIAAQAPPDWTPKPTEKKRRKLVEDEIPGDLSGNDDEKT